MQNISEIEDLVKIISKLLGLGPKSAKRIVLKLINNKLNLALEEANKSRQLEQSLQHLKNNQASLLAREKLASIGVLTAGVAHEINNPLNFIKGGVIALENFIEDFAILSFSIISKYSSIECFLFISFKIFVDPLWTGKCNNGINLLHSP